MTTREIPLPLTLLLALTWAILAQPLHAQPAALRGVDVYRSRYVSTSTLEERFAPLLDSINAAVSTEDMDAIQRTMGSLGRRIRTLAPFAYVGLSPIQYLHGDTTVWYLTVDLVDSLDVGRLDFNAEPTGQVGGLDSLLAVWRSFESSGWSQRAFWTPGESCPAYHCVFSFSGPDFAPYAEVLRQGAEDHAEDLETMLATDADAEDRATAAFVFAHHPDEARVARAMMDRTRDPSSAVRNNAMRVLAFMTRELDSSAVPLEPFLLLIDGPTTTDRNKALAILDGLANDPAHRPVIQRRAGSALLELLALRQPNNHDFAYSILKKLSGEDFGPRAYDEWERWLMGNIEMEARR